MKKETFTLDQEEHDIKEYHGFVYIVRDTKNMTSYIGEKSFWSKKRVEGKKNRITVESNWQKYTTSSNYIKQQYKLRPDDFTFDILYLCSDKSVMKYMEHKLIISLGCLESDQWLNANARITMLCKVKDLATRITPVNVLQIQGQ